jgi:hypothetical protein
LFSNSTNYKVYGILKNWPLWIFPRPQVTYFREPFSKKYGNNSTNKKNQKINFLCYLIGEHKTNQASFKNIKKNSAFHGDALSGNSRKIKRKSRMGKIEMSKRVYYVGAPNIKHPCLLSYSRQSLRQH